MGSRGRLRVSGPAAPATWLLTFTLLVLHARAAMKMGPITCAQAFAQPALPCTPIVFKPYMNLVPLSRLHAVPTAPGALPLGDTTSYFEVVPLTGSPTTRPVISMCEGPQSITGHLWGTDGAGKPVYAAPNSLLMYSYDGTGQCANPTYIGPALVALQYGGRQNVTTKNLWPTKHPLDFAVDARTYDLQQNLVLDSYPARNITYVPKTGGQVPGVIHTHGLVAKVENDGVPAFTLTQKAGTGPYGEYTIDLPDVSNPPSLLLYHDHAYGFTRLNVYAGAAGAFLVKENNNILPTTDPARAQPKPTRACTGPTDIGPCNFPELGGTPGDTLPNGISLNGIQDIPLVIQDKTVVLSGAAGPNPLGELAYALPPCNTGGPWAPEFFGDTNFVNGRAFPFLQLWPGWFRLRLTNVAQARTYQLSFSLFNRCWKIATEAGYVRFPQKLNNAALPLFPAERVELLCDFTGVKGSWAMSNNNPKPAANPGANQIIRFDFVLPVPATPTAPAPLIPRFSATTPLATVPDLAALYLQQGASLPVGVSNPVKHIMLKELLDPAQKPACPLKLAISECNGAPAGPAVLPWGLPANCLNAANEPNRMLAEVDAITCKEGLIEQWVFYNPTADFHPMHWHLNHVQCNYANGVNELKDTVPIPNTGGNNALYTPTLTCYVPCVDAQFLLNAGARQQTVGGNGLLEIQRGYDHARNTGPPSLMEVQQNGGNCTSAKDFRYVFHCHILEHEEWDMMSKFEVVPKGCPDNPLQ